MMNSQVTLMATSLVILEWILLVNILHKLHVKLEFVVAFQWVSRDVHLHPPALSLRAQTAATSAERAERERRQNAVESKEGPPVREGERNEN